MKPVHAILVATIAAFAPSCSSVWTCDPPKRLFIRDADVTRADVDYVLKNWEVGASGTIECATACRAVHERAGGWPVLTIETCKSSIDLDVQAAPHEVVGSVRCEGTAIEYLCEGRRPRGYIGIAAQRSDLPGHLANCARLEAAAVIAFDDLATALQSWNAPQALIERCRLARGQEVEHARAVGALAHRYGAAPTTPQRTQIVPTLFALALDNAVEGCVNESFAALRAEWIARWAQDDSVRALYRQLAADEAAHAQLSWDLHTWFCTQLDPGKRAQIQAAQGAALAALPDHAAAHVGALPQELALPDAATTRAMSRYFCDRLRAA